MSSRANGKVILLGEHAVVYGHPALAAAISPGAEAVATVATGLSLRVSPWGQDFVPDDGSDLGRALSVLADALGATGLSIALTLHLPGGAGLGSSAAMGVACIRAVAEAQGRELNDGELLEFAQRWESVFHGNPSGIDHTFASKGGVGVYLRGAGFERVALRRVLRVCVADSGERASTREMVQNVARQRARRPEVTDQTFEAIGALVRNGKLAIEAGDVLALGQLMTLNQALLASLFVSSERIEQLCEAARGAGAHGAKLTGAGGGGCVVAMAGENERRVCEAWRDLGAPCMVLEIGR